jgi:hypothetical protein
MDNTNEPNDTIITTNIKILNKNNIFENIRNLPDELIIIIKEYLPKIHFTFTNKNNYTLYHELLKPTIVNFEKYIRDMIRRDNHFVFEYIVKENIFIWLKIKNYRYKNAIFKNYIYFVTQYCIENESNNCRNCIPFFLKEHGLDKNIHKKKMIKYI